MTAADQKPEPSVDARALLKDIQARYDVFRNFSPLAIGIDKQLLAQQPDLNRKALRMALRSQTMATRYLKEMEKAEQRKAEQNAARAAEEAAKAEQRRLEKLISQLTEKFGRKAR